MQWGSFPPISLLLFFYPFLCPTHSRNQWSSFSFPLHEQFILLLAAKLAPNVIISWCLCAFTYAFQQGPVFGSGRLPCSPPPPCDVEPYKKISQEVFKLPCRVDFFFRVSRFHDNTHTPLLSEQFTLALPFLFFLDILLFKQLLQYVSFQLPWRFTQCLQWTELCFQLLPIIFWQRSLEARLCDWWTVCEARFKGKELI